MFGSESSGVRVIDVARRFFNDTSGWSILERIAHNCLDRNTRSMYLPLSAFSALIQYAQSYASFQYHAKSVKVVVQSSNGTCAESLLEESMQKGKGLLKSSILTHFFIW